jgi:acyl-CoA reductase-like NAD-dependent aldehyde dehydrogenase
VKVDFFIIQLSADGDRGPQEEAVAADGYIPIVVFANGPQSAFLVKTRKADLDAALEAAWDRIDEPKARRLQFRANVFAAMASAVESEFKTIASESDFPNDAVILFAEALAENGIDAFDEIDPCAIRFNREDLGEADYERAG